MDASTAFLSQLGPSEKAKLQKAIIDELKAHDLALDPGLVVEPVKERLRSRGEAWVNDVLRRFEDDPEGILALIRHNLKRQSLSPEERKRLKDQASAVYRREALEKRPPTPKQIDWIHKLGYQGEICSHQHATDLIDTLTKGRNN